MNDNKKNDKNNKGSYSLPIGMCIGIAIGTAIGAATHNNGVSVVMAIVPGRCPAAKSSAEIILAAANTLTGISILYLQNSFEIMSTSKDMKNSLIMTSSITPPTSRPAIIFGTPGDT